MKIIAWGLPVAAIFLLLVAYVFRAWVMKAVEPDERMRTLILLAKEKLIVFRKKEYKALAVGLLLTAVAVGFLAGWSVAALFCVGGVVAFFVGELSCRFAPQASIRAASLAKEGGLSRTMRLSFRSGAVSSLCSIGFCFLVLSLVFAVFSLKAYSLLAGFAFGVGLSASLEILGEAFFTEGLEKDVRKEREVAVIAGWSEEHFLSYAASVAAAVVLSASDVQIIPSAGNAFLLDHMSGALFPLAVLAAAALGSVLAVIFVRGKGGEHATATIPVGILLNALLVIVAAFPLSWIFFQGFNCAFALSIGLFFALAISRLAAEKSETKGKSVKFIAENCTGGWISGMLNGLSRASMSTFWSLFCLLAAIFIAKAFAGTYGITLAAVGGVSVTVILFAAETFGLLTGNAAYVSRKEELSPAIRDVTGTMEFTARRTMMSGRGFSVGVSALTTTALFFAYMASAKISVVDLSTSRVIIGSLLGIFFPVLVSGLLLGRFSEKWTGRKIHREAADLSPNESIKDAWILILITGAVPLLTGLFLGTVALAGLIIGMTGSTLILVTVNETAGNLFSTVKKYIEADHYGGAGSPAHETCLALDEFTAPLKKHIGPCLSVLIRFAALEALVLAPFLADIGGLL